ncbi:MAG: radical SAM protein, partial [Candidatus Ranarchaeia archaeon]
MIAFGPVPSRRLGRSLGINNIPPKFCSYSCIYCQVGRTKNFQIKRQKFFDPKSIFDEVVEKIGKSKQLEKTIDYLTFVPDGEPTLDQNLGKEISMLKKLGIKIAVITNSSLINLCDVQDDLLKSDWVSLKIDSIHQQIWKKIDRPFYKLDLSKILDGLKEFTKKFKGIL